MSIFLLSYKSYLADYSEEHIHYVCFNTTMFCPGLAIELQGPAVYVCPLDNKELGKTSSLSNKSNHILIIKE